MTIVTINTSNIMSLKQDQNFDNLASRFRKNIYDTDKGKIRLNILWRDFVEGIPNIEKGGLSILDAGAGQGNFALQLAQNNNQLTLCDVSEEMLSDARDLFLKNNFTDGVDFIHAPVQELSQHIDKQYDVVLFHAVLEWLIDPKETLKQLLKFIKPNGYLSLMFYSKTGLIYQNLTRGNFDYVMEDSLKGHGKTLTPINPQDPEDVYRWLTEFDLSVILKSGVRVFYDGISRERRKQLNFEDLIKLEKQFSRKEPYCSLARYVHVLVQK